MNKLLNLTAALMCALSGAAQAQHADLTPAMLGDLTKEQAVKFKAVSPEEATRLFERAIEALAPGSDVAAAGIVGGAIAAHPERLIEIVEASVRVKPMLAPVTVATAVGVHPEQATKVAAAARTAVRQTLNGQSSAPKAVPGEKLVIATDSKPKATEATLGKAIGAASRAASSNGEVSGWLWGVKGRPVAVVRPIDALNQAAAGLPVLHAIEEEGGGVPIDPGGGGEEGGGTPVDPGGGEEGGGGSVSNNTPP